jgi:hypothetical protein
MTDKGLMFSQAGDYQGSDAPGILSRNPWLQKVPGETPVYEASARFDTRELGFDHLIDELKNSINPASDLPARLRWKPEDLEKVTMEQAVKRVHDINEYRAAKKAEANEVLARNPATVDFKTYETVPGTTEPNKMGLAWKEIAYPLEMPLPEGYSVKPDPIINRQTGEVDNNSYRLMSPDGEIVGWGTSEENAVTNFFGKKALKDALKYEGDVMGHCVGGYCDDVMSGNSQIYSLRDKKGEPHVTIEVRPTQAKQGFVGDQRPSEADYYRLQEEWLEGNKAGTIDPNLTFAQWWRSTQGIPEPEVSYEIIQIKGKGNRAPKEEYLPFVQDFVRSGNWSRVGDIQNAGMRPTSSVFSEGELKMLRDLGETNIPPALSGVDIQRLHNLINPEGKRLIYDARGNIVGDETRRGYADGGAVMPAAEIGGGEFVRVAEKYGLGSDNATLNRIVQLVNKGMSLDQAAKKLASKSRVRISDNPDTMRLELANGGAVGQERSIGSKLVGGGVRGAGMRAIFGMDLPENATKAEREVYANVTAMTNTPTPFALAAAPAALVKGVKGATKAAKEVPPPLPRAAPKTKAEIEAIAERIAPQMLGEYVRKSPESAVTVAGKTKKQFEREKELPVQLTGEAKTPEAVDIQTLKGKAMMGILGDPSITGRELESVGDIRLGMSSPQHGGPLYGMGREDEAFWASGKGAAKKVQNLADEISKQYGADVLGKYIMMGPEGLNYAQHFADANLQAIDLSKMNKRQIEGFNSLIRRGTPNSGPRPDFPGIEDKQGAYLWMAFDPEIRKHFNSLMQMNTVTEKFNLPSGQDIRFAITEPSLRDLERGVTGMSIGQMRPGAELTYSKHPTYEMDIPGKFIGSSKYPVPYELMFPDTVKSIRENPRQAPQEFGSLGMVGPRQIIDQQMIDEIKLYEERMKRLTGKKKGGAVKKQAGGAIKAAAKAVKPSADQAAKMASQQAEMALKNRAMQELKAQFEDLPLGQQPQGWMSPERLQQKIEEIRRREATPAGGQIPLLKKGGQVKFTGNLDAMRLAVQKRK